MKHIVILGWYGENNLGDNAFQDVFCQEFPGHSMTFLQSMENYKGHTPDLIIFGGGGVVRGGYLRGLEPYVGQVPMLALGVDVAANGPEYDAWTKIPFERVVVRSQEYAAVLQSQGIKTSYVPDLVYGLDLGNDTFVPRNGKIATVNLTEDVTPKAFANMAKAFREMLGDGWGLVFTPLFSGHKNPDNKWNELMAKELGGSEVSVVRHISTAKELVYHYGNADLTIGMRFHSTILSTMAATPLVAVGRPGKQSLFCAQEDLSSLYVNTEAMDSPEYFLNRVDAAVSGASHWSDKFTAMTAKNKALVLAMFDEIRKAYLD
jgi:polysaccharide pyruvyl transferase WcaK-like protein